MEREASGLGAKAPVGAHEQSAQEIAEMTNVSWPTVFNYLDLFLSGGVKALLQRQYRGGKKATVKSSHWGAE